MNNIDKTIRENSIPPVSSGMFEQGDQLLRTGMMKSPQVPGTLGMVGKYQIIRMLGEGGMGQVMLAREPVTDSLVAVKLIKPEFVKKDWAVHRFLTEARHMFKMSHPSILRVHEVSDRPEGPYFVMPFMAGGSLAEKIKPGEPMSADLIRPIARQVAEALNYAHARGIIHRDLKPSNILLDGEGHAYLCDFGLLRTVFNDSMVDVTKPHVEGTVPYMSPAMAEGKAEDTRCDIYAFGCLLYELLTGQAPYQGPSVDAVLRQIVAGPPRPIRQLNPNAPAHLVAIVEHAMGRTLRDRYATMADVIGDLDRAAQGKSPLGPHGKVAASPNTRKFLAAAGGVVLVGLLAFSIAQLQFWKSRGNPNTTTSSTTTVTPAGEIAPDTERIIDLGNGVTMKFVWIPATTSEAWKTISGGKDYFLMGSMLNGKNSNETQHAVKLTEGFWMAQTEVTQAQWDAIQDDNLSRFHGKDLPVEGVSPNDATAYCRKLNAKGLLPEGWKWALPTEAQWEYACRAGTTGAFAGDLDEMAWYDKNSGGTTHAVATKKPNAWGLYDMHGNVYEWCADWWDAAYPEGAVTDPKGPATGSLRVARSGGWNHGTVSCRSAQRSGWGLDNRSAANGGVRLTVVPAGDSATEPDANTIQAAGAKLPLGTSAPLVEGPFTYTVKDGAVTIVKYTGSGGEVKIPDKIKGMPVTGIDSAFRDCTNLTSVTIPNSVISIGLQAFRSCPGLTSITIPASVTYIGQHAFADCVHLSRVTIPKGVTSIAGNPFHGCTELVSIEVDAGNPAYSHSIEGIVFDKERTTLVCYPSGKAGSYVISGSISNIGLDAFNGCTSLTDIKIPNSVTNISWGAFMGCSGLTNLTIPSSVASIGSRAFYRCTGLANVTIPNGVSNIENDTFHGCHELTNVTIPSSVATIGRYAFANCARLASVTIANGVISIQKEAFYRCPNLTSIYFKGNAPALSDGVFEGGADKATIYYLAGTTGWGKEFGGRPTAVWDGVAQAVAPVALWDGPFGYTVTNGAATIIKYSGPGGAVAIPGTIKGMPVTGIDSAFRDCTNMTSVTIPNTVNTIASFSFSSCTALTNPFIPASVTNMGSSPFIRCSRVISITVDAKNPKYSSEDGVVFDKEKTALLIFPAGRTGNYAVPASVRQIKGNAFRDCQELTGVTLPPRIEVIEFSAFSRCPMLSGVYFNGAAPDLGAGAFNFCNATIYHLPTTKGWGKEFGGRPTAVWNSQAQDQFTYTTNNGAIAITKYTGPGGEVVIPDKINGLLVTSIGAQAFTGCTKLTSVTIPNSVSSVAQETFSGCANLITVSFKGNAPTGGADASVFAGSDKTTVYYLPGLKRWTDTFGGRPAQFQVQDYNCSVKDGAVTIAKYTGKGGNVVIPDKTEGLPVTTIGDNAFSGNAQLTSVKIPNSVTYIGFFAFQDCPKLTSVNIPASVSSIRWAPFAGCTSLTTIPVDEANTAYSSKEGVLFDKDKTYLFNYPAGKAGSYVIPSTVSQLGCASFMGCSKLTQVTMPDYPRMLCNGSVFYGCSSLTQVTLPSRLNRIGNWEFSDCTNLASITIPASVASIGRSVFRRCPNLAAVYFMGNAPTPDDGGMFAGNNKATVYYLSGTTGWTKEFLGRPTALWDAKSMFTYTVNNNAITLTKYIGPGGDVVIPSTVNGLPVASIGDGAFQDCTNLKRVTISSSVTRIGSAAFHGCAGLTRVTIPASVTEIGRMAFGHCYGLTNIAMTKGVTALGDYSFYYCTALTNVTIPASVTSIGVNPFRCCFRLSSIEADTASPAFSSEDGALFDKKKTRLISCPGDKSGCYDIPKSTTTIGNSAFRGCNKLTSVTVPEPVTDIETRAFKNCTCLTEVIFRGDAPKLGSEVFIESTKVTVYYLPGTTGWGKEFGGRPTAVWAGTATNSSSPAALGNGVGARPAPPRVVAQPTIAAPTMPGVIRRIPGVIYAQPPLPKAPDIVAAAMKGADDLLLMQWVAQFRSGYYGSEGLVVREPDGPGLLVLTPTAMPTNTVLLAVDEDKGVVVLGRAPQASLRKALQTCNAIPVRPYGPKNQVPRTMEVKFNEASMQLIAGWMSEWAGYGVLCHSSVMLGGALTIKSFKNMTRDEIVAVLVTALSTQYAVDPIGDASGGFFAIRSRYMASLTTERTFNSHWPLEKPAGKVIFSFTNAPIAEIVKYYLTLHGSQVSPPVMSNLVWQAEGFSGAASCWSPESGLPAETVVFGLEQLLDWHGVEFMRNGANEVTVRQKFKSLPAALRPPGIIRSRSSRSTSQGLQTKVVEPPKLSGEALEKHLRDFQKELIQNGMPPLPMVEPSAP